MTMITVETTTKICRTLKGARLQGELDELDRVKVLGGDDVETPKFLEPGQYKIIDPNLEAKEELSAIKALTENWVESAKPEFRTWVFRAIRKGANTPNTYPDGTEIPNAQDLKDVLAKFDQRYAKYPQYRSFRNRAKLYRAKRATGARGVTWFEAGDVSIMTKMQQISAFVWRPIWNSNHGKCPKGLEGVMVGMARMPKSFKVKCLE